MVLKTINVSSELITIRSDLDLKMDNHYTEKVQENIGDIYSLTNKITGNTCILSNQQKETIITMLLFFIVSFLFLSWNKTNMNNTTMPNNFTFTCHDGQRTKHHEANWNDSWPTTTAINVDGQFKVNWRKHCFCIAAAPFFIG